MSHKVFICKCNYENKLNNGEYLVAYDLEELTLPSFKSLYCLLEILEDSFYHVGYKMGAVLASIHHLAPTVRLGGAELEDLYSAYSNKLFDTGNMGINFEVQNFLEGPSHTKYGLVYSDDILSKYELENQKIIVNNMLETSTKYVVFNEKVPNDLVQYIESLGHKVDLADNTFNLTVITKAQKPITKEKVTKDE